MNIETNKVRVISNTTEPNNEEMNKMIGREYEIRQNHCYDRTVLINNSEESDSFWFKKSDVRFLTPIKFKDRHVAIGDRVRECSNWLKVIGFAEAEKEICLFVEYQGKIDFKYEDDIQDHDPGIETDDPLKNQSEDVAQKIQDLYFQECHARVSTKSWEKTKAIIKEALKNKLK